MLKVAGASLCWFSLPAIPQQLGILRTMGQKGGSCWRREHPASPLLVSLLWIPSALPDCEAEPLAISGLDTALLNNCQDMSSSTCKSQQHWAFLLFKTVLPSTPLLAAGEKWACYKRHILSLPWPFCLLDITPTRPTHPHRSRFPPPRAAPSSLKLRHTDLWWRTLSVALILSEFISETPQDYIL